LPDPSVVDRNRQNRRYVPSVPSDLGRRPTREPPESWQHFFIWGWIPGEKRINAASACGGAEHVKRIETRQTFAQGLIEAVASYYFNIYAPYTGAVICDDNTRAIDSR
jgi:hypothetical protein